MHTQCVENANRQPARSLAASWISYTIGHDYKTPHIAFSQERDNRTAQFTIPTNE
jgi:hypothetical protein